MLERRVWRDFLAVTASVAVLGIGVGSTLPLTALVLTARGLGPQIVGWMAAAVALGGVAGTLAAPAASLRFGRRRVMLGCVAVAGISVMSLQYVEPLWAWWILRMLFGASMAPLFVLGEAWINTLPGDAVRGRVVAIYTTSFTLCQLVGPLLTAALAHRPGHSFLICGAVFLLGIPGIALADDAPANPSAFQAVKDAGASWLTILRTAPAIVAGAGLFAAFDNVTLSFLPLFALDRGLTEGRALAAGVIVPGLFDAYLFVLGAIAGSIYTLSMVSSGERFSGAALLRASGLIALTWNLSSVVAPAATGMVMQHIGSWTVTTVLWIMAVGFVLATRAERGPPE
jgi:MFS family permease